MANQISVRKSSGEKQEFSEEKLYNSLRNSGATHEISQDIIIEIRNYLFEGISTRSIYRKAFTLLRNKVKSTASRYSLKQAILELGPTGYPFEKYIGALMNRLGYETHIGQIAQGTCVTHEVDVIAWKNDLKILIECKYHNQPGKLCNVQVPLYINSRFIDVKTAWERLPENQGRNYQGWVVTNTRFSEDASTYGKCAGLHLVGWDYPRRGSLKELVETTRLFPVTAISGLNKKQKQILIENNFILCSDLSINPKALDLLNLPARQLIALKAEIEDLL